MRELEADCEELAGQLALERAKPRQDRFRLLLELRCVRFRKTRSCVAWRQPLAATARCQRDGSTDVFHFKREIGRWLRGQEARCYELMEQVEQARRWTEHARLLDSARIQARIEYRQQTAVLDERLLAFDWVELIVNYLYESLTAYDTRRHVIRTKADADQGAGR